jgi:hypothetical protein
MGKALPLDPDPHPNGNVVPEHQAAAGQEPRAVVLSAPPTDRPAWISHYVTCPHADSHRRT